MALKPFPHRHNKDGSFDSICVRCFLTIATSKTEVQLEKMEKLHVCNEFNLMPREKPKPKG